MRQLSFLILLAAPVMACSSSPSGGADDGDGVDGGNGVVVDPPTPVGPDVEPDFGCKNQPPTVNAVDPIVLAGKVTGVTLAGLSPVDAADVALFRAGEPVVLARTHSAGGGAFSTGNVASAGHPLHAYLKATKDGYRTSFFYPPTPFADSAANLVVPFISDGAFDAVRATLGATQDDRHNGVLLVEVVDCSGNPLNGATLTVHRGNSPNELGQQFDLGTIVPGAKGVFLVFNVPDGKVFVSASYLGTQLPEHDVMVRANDPDCDSPKGTLTSTIVRP